MSEPLFTQADIEFLQGWRYGLRPGHAAYDAFTDLMGRLQQWLDQQHRTNKERMRREFLDSASTNSTPTSFTDVGRMQRAMIQAGMIEQAIAPLPTPDQLQRIEELPFPLGSDLDPGEG